MGKEIWTRRCSLIVTLVHDWLYTKLVPIRKVLYQNGGCRRLKEISSSTPAYCRHTFLFAGFYWRQVNFDWRHALFIHIRCAPSADGFGRGCYIYPCQSSERC